MRAGFAELDISPARFPVRTYLGRVDRIMDPLYAKAAVFDDGEGGVFAFVSMDVVIVEASYARRIKELAAKSVPVARIMVCATHNHACPAIVDRPTCLKEPDYIELMIAKAAAAIVLAAGRLAEVETGSGSGLESRVSFNRRFIKRDGTVVTHPGGKDLEDILRNEGVIDPELGVLAVRDARGGGMAGALVNFGCHAVHHMGQVSGGYPGVLSKKLKERFGDAFVCVFLNGPCGDVHHANHLDPSWDCSMETMGERLAQTTLAVIDKLAFAPGGRVASGEGTVKVKYRPLSELKEKLARPEKLLNVLGNLPELGWYGYSLEVLRQLHAQADGEDALVQAVRIGDAVFASVPAEYFMAHGLRIKRESPLRKTYVVSLANGWLGYIPTQEAFTRDGGHETTQALWSKMEHGAGDLLADQAVKLIKEVTR